MGTNCLITKLQGSVDNDNLPIFDTIRLKFEESADTKSLYVTNSSSSETIHVKAIDNSGNVIVDKDVLPTITTNIEPPISPVVYNVYIKGKEYVGDIVKTAGITYSLDDFSYAIASNIILPYCTVHGNLLSLAHNIKTQQIRLKGMLEASTTKGNIEDLLVALLNNGKTTDLNIDCNECKGYIKFLGVTPSSVVTGRNGMHCTFENGNTINVYTDSEKTNLYATYNNEVWSLANNA